MSASGSGPPGGKDKPIWTAAHQSGGLVYGIQKKPPGRDLPGRKDRREILGFVDLEKSKSGAGAGVHHTVDALNKRVGALEMSGSSVKPLPSAPPEHSTAQEQQHLAHQQVVASRFEGAGLPPQQALPYDKAVKRNNKAALTQGTPVHFNVDFLDKPVIDKGGSRGGAFTSAEARFTRRNLDRLSDHVSFYSKGQPISPGTASLTLGRPGSGESSADEDDLLFGSSRRRTPSPPRTPLPNAFSSGGGSGSGGAGIGSSGSSARAKPSGGPKPFAALASSDSASSPRKSSSPPRTPLPKLSSSGGGGASSSGSGGGAGGLKSSGGATPFTALAASDSASVTGSRPPVSFPALPMSRPPTRRKDLGPHFGKRLPPISEH